MVNETLILRKLSELDEYTTQVQDFRGISVKDYRDDWKSQRIIERTLQMMIETCNIIVHHYDRVDAEIVVGILRNRIEDFNRFKNAIVAFLKNTN